MPFDNTGFIPDQKLRKHQFRTATKLHELLKIALEDYEAVLADRRYVIDMKTWHSPTDSGKCAVCLAGACIAKSLGQVPDQDIEPEDFDPDIRPRLLALNYLREGYVADAARQFDIIIGDEIDFRCQRERESNKSYLRRVHAYLVKEDL